MAEDRTINDARTLARGRNEEGWLRLGWITNAIHEANTDCKARDRPEWRCAGSPHSPETESNRYPGHTERLIHLAIKHQRRIASRPVEYQDIICAIRNGKRTRSKIVDFIVSHGIGKGRIVNDFTELPEILSALESVNWIKQEATAHGNRYFLTAEGHLVHKFGIVM